MEIENLRAAFKSLFGSYPVITRSPGRINILGEHTDYNGGFVMPAAIDKAIYAAISRRDDDHIHLYSQNFKESFQTCLSEIRIADISWVNYILGVVDQLQKKNFKIGGFNLSVYGDIPLGAGLSSSAAVECAVASAISDLFRLSISELDIALIAQKAEHTFAGVNCGIMDQFASVFGRKDHAILLDCRSMEYRYVPLNLKGHKLLLLNTNVKHALSESAYNERRAQCEQGVEWIKAVYPEVQSLRDVTVKQLIAHVRNRDPGVYTKCRFVVEENTRLVKAAEYLEQGDLQALGQLMFETHAGLSRDYEVSCEELDFLVNSVSGSDEVLGARMMGGGFGGCTLNIVKEGTAESFIEKISGDYRQRFGHDLSPYMVETSDGTGQIN